MAYAQMDDGYDPDDFDDFEEALRVGHPDTPMQKRAPGIGESPERHRQEADDIARVQCAAPEAPKDSPYDLKDLSEAMYLSSGSSQSATLIERRKTSYHKKESSMSAPADKPLFEVGEIRIARRVTQKASSPSIRRPKTSPARQPDTPRSPLSPGDGVGSAAKVEDRQTPGGVQTGSSGGLLSASECYSPATTPVQVVRVSQANEEAARRSFDRCTVACHQSLQADLGALTAKDCLTPRGRSPQGSFASSASPGSVHSVLRSTSNSNSEVQYACVAIAQCTLQPAPVGLFRSNSARNEKAAPSRAAGGHKPLSDRLDNHAPSHSGLSQSAAACRQDQQFPLGHALDVHSRRPDEGRSAGGRTSGFLKATDGPLSCARNASPGSLSGYSDDSSNSRSPLASQTGTASPNAAQEIEQTRQSLPLQPQAARQALLRPEDIVVEEAIVMEPHSTLFGIRRRLVSTVPDLGEHGNSPTLRFQPNHTHMKSLREAEAQLAAREADLTIEALARTETASVEISIYTEQREGQWMVRGPAPAGVKRVDVLPNVLDVWKVPLDTKSIVERGKLKSTLELAKTRRAIPCSECIYRVRTDGQCPRCGGTEYIETIFVITITLRVSSFGSLKLPACHLAGVVLPEVKYMQSPSEAVRSALLREQAINTVLRAARRVGQEHEEAHGARLLMAKAQVERRGRMTVRVTSSRTGVRRCFDVGDEGGEIVEVSETGVPIALVETAPLATPTFSFSSSQTQNSRPSTAQSPIHSASRPVAASTIGRRPATSGSDVRFRDSSRKSRYSTQIERPAPGTSPGSGSQMHHGPRPSTASSTATTTSSSSLSFSVAPPPPSRSEVRPARFFTSSRHGSLASLRSEGTGRPSPVGEQGSYGREADRGDRTRRRSDETVRGSQDMATKPVSAVKTGKGLRRLFSRG